MGTGDKDLKTGTLPGKLGHLVTVQLCNQSVVVLTYM